MIEDNHLQTTNNGLYKSETLYQMISSLEKIENVSNNTLMRLNNALLERKNKVSNLHSRIIRINEILSYLESIPQALKILSKRFYPDNVESYIFKSIFYNEINDYSFIEHNNQIINNKLSNNIRKI